MFPSLYCSNSIPPSSPSYLPSSLLPRSFVHIVPFTWNIPSCTSFRSDCVSQSQRSLLWLPDWIEWLSVFTLIVPCASLQSYCYSCHLIFDYNVILLTIVNFKLPGRKCSWLWSYLHFQYLEKQQTYIGYLGKIVGIMDSITIVWLSKPETWVIFDSAVLHIFLQAF